MPTILKTSLESSRFGLDTFRLSWMADSQPISIETAATVLVFAFNDRGELAISRHPERGWQIPGGHIEAGETPEEGAHREVFEEARVVLSLLKPVGYIAMELLVDKPANYPYPYPIRHCQVYSARIDRVLPFEELPDATDRTFCHPDELQHMSGDFGHELLFLSYATA